MVPALPKTWESLSEDIELGAPLHPRPATLLAVNLDIKQHDLLQVSHLQSPEGHIDVHLDNSCLILSPTGATIVNSRLVFSHYYYSMYCLTPGNSQVFPTCVIHRYVQSLSTLTSRVKPPNPSQGAVQDERAGCRNRNPQTPPMPKCLAPCCVPRSPTDPSYKKKRAILVRKIPCT